MLDLLAGAGADLTVRLSGRTLLHLAARDGNLEVATWMLDHGLDPDLRNDCSNRCDEAGQTALHDAQAVRADDMSALLLARGAEVDAIAQNGRTPLHLAAQGGQLGGAFVLCRHGADPARRDIQGQTPVRPGAGAGAAARSEPGHRRATGPAWRVGQTRRRLCPRGRNRAERRRPGFRRSGAGRLRRDRAALRGVARPRLQPAARRTEKSSETRAPGRLQRRGV